jgi:DNA-binding MarR family transcriptional regulator
MSDADHPQYPALLGLLLRLAYQHWAEDMDAALRAAGFDDIRPPHANVFPFVPAEGIQVSELARLARVTKQTMAQAVEGLERLGYVERRPDPGDRRAKLVFLTERGQAVPRIAATTGPKVEARWAELIGREDLETLRDLLQRLLGALQDSPDEITDPTDTAEAG